MIKRPPPDPVDADQESVWDYPRPPALEPERQRLALVIGDLVLAQTTRGYRVLETSHPPVYYFPPEDVRMDLLVPNGRSTHCEWKGRTVLYDLVLPDRRVQGLAWAYPDPSPRFAAIRDHVAFYAGRIGHAWVGDEEARPQPGSFYGGWITDKVRGPFKGAPGSLAW